MVGFKTSFALARSVDLAAVVAQLARGLEQREPAPGVFSFAERRAMHRVRSYTSAALSPFADRGVQDMVLLGHLHTKEGKVVLVEGFNGQDGIRWTEKALAILKANDLMAPAATVRPETPMRGCPQAVPH